MSSRSCKRGNSLAEPQQAPSIFSIFSRYAIRSAAVTSVRTSFPVPEATGSGGGGGASARAAELWMHVLVSHVGFRRLRCLRRHHHRRRRRRHYHAVNAPGTLNTWRSGVLAITLAFPTGTPRGGLRAPLASLQIHSRGISGKLVAATPASARPDVFVTC